MKILIIALSGIGDALMFTPAIQKISESHPDSEIDALVMYSGVKDIYENLPSVNKIYNWDFLNKSLFSSLAFVLSLRNKYDATINVYPSNRKEYNLISFLIGAKKRAAVKYLRKDFANFGFLNNTVITENDSLHNVEENIGLVSALFNKHIFEIPPLQFLLNENDFHFAGEFLKFNNIEKSEIVIGLHPGCNILKNHIQRRWESDKFAAIADALTGKYKAKILVFGGPDENDLKNEVISKMKSKAVAAVNSSSLGQTAAVMKRCTLFISNDSSLMHVAAALRLNVVAIIGPTNKNYIYPWKTNFRIASLNLDCAPCFFYSPKPLRCSRNDVKYKCIRELGVQQVLDNAEEMLNDSL